ncbi:hypothetical protein [Paenibacillus sp. PL91]|uniref:hypothetical protein n=1 Tax=Paenibacillus sp. PL91 TaxID=2729538 RepID=UPI00145D6476|nr:hypothetical protein [Paenibacillus sp. PL91]MBC9204164.1 hypothetical protein [Paenibacillus sp. PL91]
MVLGMVTPKKQELLRQRAAVLKQYEVFSCQVAYYLLEDETLAVQAASQALFELLQDEEFYYQNEYIQKQKTKQSVMKNSLLRKASSYQKGGN